MCPQKSDVCRSRRDSALAEDGSAAQKCDKDLVGLQKTMEMSSQENKISFIPSVADVSGVLSMQSV